MMFDKSLTRKIAAALLMIVGLIGIVTAWSDLLFTGTKNFIVVAIELGGVAVCLIGYFLWKSAKVQENGSKQP